LTINTQTYLDLLESPEDALAVSYEALEDLLIKHPYMIGVRLLLLTKYQKDGSPRLSDYLKLCAAYCPDRRVLFNWVNKFKQAPQLVTSQEEAALNNEQLETSEVYKQVTNIIKFDPSNNSVGLGVLNLENESIDEAPSVPSITETPVTPIESLNNQSAELENVTQNHKETTLATDFSVLEFVVDEAAVESFNLQEQEDAEVVKIELGEVLEIAEPKDEAEDLATSDSSIIFGEFEEDVFDTETFIPDFDNLLISKANIPLHSEELVAEMPSEPVLVDAINTDVQDHAAQFTSLDSEPIQPSTYVYEHPIEAANFRIDYFDSDKEQAQIEEHEEHEVLIESFEGSNLAEKNQITEQKEEDNNNTSPITIEVLDEEKEQEQNTMDNEHFIQPKNGNKLVVSEFSSWLRTLKSKTESTEESQEQKIVRNFKKSNVETSPTSIPPAISQSNAIRNQIDKDENYMANDEDSTEIFEQIEDLASKSIEDNNDIVSETLAQILTRQGKTDRALIMYKRLRIMFPDKKAYFSDIISKLSPPK
jgi:hypothetical protein